MPIAAPAFAGRRKMGGTMTAAKLFLHGVPDSPAIWRPLLAALDLGESPVAVPALPGFTGQLPAGFPATKEAYADWAVGEAEALAGQHGPIDIVGHDWGGLIAQRVAMLRPDLSRSWARAGEGRVGEEWVRTGRTRGC